MLAAILCAHCLASPTRAQAEPFAITGFTTQTTEPSTTDETVNDVSPFDLAGGHPFALTSTVRFGAGDPKDVLIDLPAGLVANPQAVPRCSAPVGQCPSDSQVGVFVLHIAGGEDALSVLGQIFNMTPSPGVPAEFGLEVPLLGRTLLTGRVVRTTQGYGLAMIGKGLPVPDLSGLGELGVSALHLSSLETTLWGVPAAAAHDPLRGAHCLGGLSEAESAMSCSEGGLHFSGESVPFLTMPSVCSGAPPTTVGWADSWERPGQYAQAQSQLPMMAYCELAPFSPEVSVSPETLRPEAPDGIDLTIKIPQYPQATFAAPELRAMSVTLPQGMTIDPSVANGRQSCDSTGPSGINIPTGLNASGQPLSPGEIGPGEAIPPAGLGPEEPLLTPGDCPDSSIVGAAQAVTPLFAHPLEGRVYLASPGCGGSGQAACTDLDALDGNLYRIYVQLGASADPAQNEGVLLKLAATVQANPATGQLTVRLQESPQLPLSELSLHLYGGEGSLLTNPSVCGAATTTSSLEPWSAPFAPDASPSSYFDVQDCADPQPFQPKLLAGSLDIQAGAYSPFTLTIKRQDGEQALADIQVHTPVGLSAMLSSVAPCPDELAHAGECPESSRIGGSNVTAGTGSQALTLPGSVYLTGPYKNAPYGLAIITDAATGPLNLGRLVIRGQISVDPRTAALTITTDPLPQIVLGVPLRIQRVSLLLDRPHFILNPTSCEEQQILATIASARASSVATNRYALAACASLSFKPTLVASTTARTSLANGASLDIKLKLPYAEPGTAANLARLEIALPRQLPTRLTSLQHSCRSTVFDANPAQCPGASIVGVAQAHTPITGIEMQGPVYIVSHGRDVLPSPIVLLQGAGITLELPGSTTIAKSGTSRVAFDDTPDIPLQSIEIRLPSGPDSLLAANTSLCAPGKLVTIKRRVRERTHGHVVRRIVRVPKRLPATLPLPTELAAHNGSVLHQTTQIAVTGCTPNQLRPRQSSFGASAKG
ncbi:MAG: hypothetical protein WB998_07600 [Solirubrobacteraceae bacterium]